jgi:hypothetical protein
MSYQWILVKGSNINELNFAAIVGEPVIDNWDGFIRPVAHSFNQILVQKLKEQGFLIRSAGLESKKEEKIYSHVVELPDELERKDWWYNPAYRPKRKNLHNA